MSPTATHTAGSSPARRPDGTHRSLSFRRLCLPLAAALLTSLAAYGQVPQLLNHQGRVAVGGVSFEGTGQFKFALVDGGTDISRQATATVTVSGGFVTVVTVVDGGAGYVEAPRAYVRDTKFGGTGAMLDVTIAGGAVTAISVINPGSGYTASTWIEIGAPPPTIAYQTFWANAPDTAPADGEPDAAVALPVVKGLYSVLLGDTTRANMAALTSAVFANPDVRLRVWFNDGTLGFQQLTPDARIAAAGYALMAGDVPDGAITASKIAPGAITSDQLAKPPRSGSIASSSLNIQFNQADFTVPFSPACATPPIVTLGASSGSTADWQPSLWVTDKSTTNFSGHLTAPITPVILKTDYQNGSWASMGVYSSRARIAYNDSTNGIKIVSALDDTSDSWGSPVTIVDSVNAAYISLKVWGTYIYIAYFDRDARQLRFVRYDGLNSPVTPDSSPECGAYCSLAWVNGNPAIAYLDDLNDTLKYVRATDTSGSSWGTPLTIDSSLGSGAYASLAVINGNPAVAYRNWASGSLKFVRANDASGSSWGTPIAIESGITLQQNVSLAEINGNPAISYEDHTGHKLKFIRATDASGTTWGAPQILDSGLVYTHSLAVVDGNPAIAYGSLLVHEGNRFVRATDASGSNWGTPVVIDGINNPCLQTDALGKPIVASFDEGRLEFVRAPEFPDTFSIDWIAIEP